MSSGRPLPMKAAAAIMAVDAPAAVKEHASYVIRHSPARPNSAKRQTRAWYHSAKTEETVFLEGGHLALAQAYILDHDSDVKYWCVEAPAITVKGFTIENSGTANETKKPETRREFADFFVVGTGFRYVQTKASMVLEDLCRKEAWRYTKDVIGQFHDLPAKSAAQEQGFDYELVWSFNQTLVRNWILLAPLIAEKNGAIVEVDRRIAEFVKRREGCFAEEIQLQLKVGGADVRACLAKNLIYADLAQVDVSKTEELRLFGSKDSCELMTKIEAARAMVDRPVLGAVRLPTYEAGEKIILEVSEYEVVFSHGDMVVAKGADGKNTPITKRFIEHTILGGRGTSLAPDEHSIAGAMKRMPKDYKLLKVAADREATIKPFLEAQVVNGRPRYIGRKPNRTEQRWIESYKECQLFYGWGIIGLIPQIEKRGPRKTLLNDEQEAVVAVFVRECHAHPDAPSLSLTYGGYVAYLKEQKKLHLKVSRRTFQNRVDKLNAAVVAGREGDGGVAAIEPPYWEINYTTIRHGDFPLQIVHMDHSPLDIETIDEKTGRVLGKPWLTLMYDAATRMPLAHYITYSGPSYASVYAVLRIYLTRHRHLPVMLVLDNGSDFASESAALMVRSLGIQVRFRPVRRPKFGSVMERFFGTTEQSVFHNLAGSDKLREIVGFLDRAHDPERRARFSLAKVDAIFSAFAYRFYAEQTHPALLASPKEAFDTGFRAYTKRLPVRPNDYLVRLFFLPIPRRSRGLVKVQPRVGVQIDYYRYWHPDFNDKTLEGKYLPVRYDPLNKTVAYAWLRGRWVPCFCLELQRILQNTKVSLECLSAAISKMRGDHGRSYEARCVALAEFLREQANSDEFCLEVARRTASAELFALAVDSVIEVHAGVEGGEVRSPPPLLLPPEERSSRPARGERACEVEVEADEPTPLDATFLGQFEDDVEPAP